VLQDRTRRILELDIIRPVSSMAVQVDGTGTVRTRTVIDREFYLVIGLLSICGIINWNCNQIWAGFVTEEGIGCYSVVLGLLETRIRCLRDGVDTVFVAWRGPGGFVGGVVPN